MLAYKPVTQNSPPLKGVTSGLLGIDLDWNWISGRLYERMLLLPSCIESPGVCRSGTRKKRSLQSLYKL